MNHININLRLRPIRFAFLVHPDNQEQVLEVFRINTCLWGGKFNPIIPIRRNKKGYLSEKEKQVANRYLSFFEPDFVVEAEKGISKDLDFGQAISIDYILEYEGEHGQEFQYGQSVKGLYKNLYETEFKYKHILDPYSASPPNRYNNIIYVETENLPPNDRFKNFIACNLGNFPDDEGLRYFRRNYTKFFHPKVKIFQPQNSYYLIDDFDQSPLDIGCKKLKVDYSNNEPSLFLLDVENNEDLIDFWNLRGICQNIKAVPIQCIKELSPYLKKFVKENYPVPEPDKLEEESKFISKYSGRSRKIVQPVPIFSRSISTKKVEDLYKLYIQYQYSKDIQSKWETSLEWKDSTGFLKNEHRPILEANRKEIEIKMNEKNPEINLDLLSPESEKSGGHCLWANVIKMQDLSNQIATAFPCNYGKDFINLNIIKDKFNSYLESCVFDEHPDKYPSDQRIEKDFRSTSEGLVVFSDYKNSSEKWILMDGTTVIKNWFQSNKKIETSQLSDAGRTAQQIIRLLGFEGVSSIANNNTIELLNEMSKKQLKSFQFNEFQNKVNKAIGTGSKNNSLSKILIKNKAVKLGIEIKCDKCNKLSWYSLEKLNYSLLCDFCLTSYQFPVLKPDQAKWSYRVIGPFSLLDYAQGGYAVALSIRFFTNIIGRHQARRSPMNPYWIDSSPEKSGLDDRVTWSPGQNLKLTSEENPIEVDFILWTQRWNQWKVEHSNIIFGEAKSHMSFEEKDVDNMKKLSKIFPGSILVFATMREYNDFSDIEKERIERLAKWGREYDKEKRKPRALVMILTGTELFARTFLFTAWDEQIEKLEEQGKKEQEKKYRKIKDLIIRQDDSSYLRPRALAYLTQYLYLDIPLPFKSSSPRT